MSRIIFLNNKKVLPINIFVNLPNTKDVCIKDILNSIVKKGDTVIDVGMNHMQYTRHLLNLVGKNGHVIGIEPISELCEIAKIYYFAKGPRFTIHNIAVGDCCKTAKFKEFLGSDNGLSGFNNKNNTSPFKEYYVQLTTLDSIIPISEKISLIKLDIEGSEFDALKGCIQTIKRHKPVIICEYDKIYLERFGYSLNEFVTWMQDLGYINYKIKNVKDLIFCHRSKTNFLQIDSKIFKTYNKNKF